MKHVKIRFIKKKLPVRLRQSSKIDGGKVIIVGGRKDLFGAALLAAQAATRSGAGYTHLMCDIDKYPWAKFPDFIVHPFSLVTLKKHVNSVVGIGPGLGTTNDKKKLLLYLIKNKVEKVVVDGDALTMLSKMRLDFLPSTWILTPHEGELARLLDTDSDSIKKNRAKYVQIAQKKYGCIVILKGADTLVASQEALFVVNSGTKALAKAGTGDVLLGVISALYAQGLTSLEAAITGCYIHGHASGLWLKENKDYLSMRPIDLIERLPISIHQIRSQHSM